MAEAAGQSADLDRDKLLSAIVRLGRLCFDDFRLLEPQTIQRALADPAVAQDWPPALSSAPHVMLRVRRSAVLQSAICNLQSSGATADIRSAQSRLVHTFALDLLKAKVPPLYDVLPWHDWDFSIVARRFRLWQTRVLLAGDGSSVTMCRCRKSAGVYVLEPHQTIARYVEKKGEMEKVKRLRVLRASLDKIPLADRSVDLAIIGSTDEFRLVPSVLREIDRVAADILLVDNCPLTPALDERTLRDLSYTPDSVEVRSLGPRRCWWKLSRH
jgi:hypothetical protein